MRPSSARVPSSRSRKSRIQTGISSVTMSATSIGTDGTRLNGQGHQIVLNADEPVPGERCDRLGVGGLLAGGNGAQCGRPALAEGALERPLLAQRLVAAAPARTGLGERAHPATRDAC